MGQGRHESRCKSLAPDAKSHERRKMKKLTGVKQAKVKKPTRTKDKRKQQLTAAEKVLEQFLTLSPKTTESTQSSRSLPSIPSWLPGRTKADPILTSPIRSFLNGRAEVIYYSDSTGVLNVSVKNDSKAKLIRELKKELIQRMKDPQDEKVNVQKGHPFVV